MQQQTTSSAAVVGAAPPAKSAEKRFQLQRQISSKELFSGKYTFGPSKSTTLNAALRSSPAYAHEQRISGELKSAVESIAYIAEHMKAEMSDKKIRDDWKYISMVIDRLLLLIFFGITLGGTLRILLGSPHVFDFVDQQEVIRKLIAQSKVQAEEL